MPDAIDIFISYKREERDLADMLLAALQSEGYSAVTDLDIPSSQPFSDAIDQMIKSARIVIVLWTAASAKSQWVRVEAEEAHSQKKYLGVMVENLEIDQLPMLLRGVNYLNLHDRLFEDALEPILADVTTKLGAAQKSSEVAAARSEHAQREFTAFSGAVLMNSVLAYQAFLSDFPASTFAPAARAKVSTLQSPMRRYAPSYKFMSLVLGIFGASLAYMNFTGYQPFKAPETENSQPAVVALKEQSVEIAKLEQQLLELQAKDWEKSSKITMAESALSEAETAVNKGKSDLQELQARMARSENKFSEKQTELINDRNAAKSELRDTRQSLESAKAAVLTEKTRATNLVNERDSLLLKIEALTTEIETKASLLRQAQQKALEVAKPKSNCTENGTAGIRIADLCVSLDATVLDLSGKEVADLSPLAGLTSLQTLYLDNTQVADLSPLAGLTTLQRLYLSGTQVADLSPLAGLTALQGLYLSGTHVADLTPLAGLTALQRLYLSGTQVAGLSPLAGLTALQGLTLKRIEIEDLGPIKLLEKLRWLQVGDREFGSFVPSDEDRDAVQAFLATL